LRDSAALRERAPLEPVLAPDQPKQRPPVDRSRAGREIPGEVPLASGASIIDDTSCERPRDSHPGTDEILCVISGEDDQRVEDDIRNP